MSEDDVWAVGYRLRNGHLKSNQLLIEHWDGQAWSIVGAPARAHSASSLESVSMDGPRDGFAVGDSTFAEHTSAYSLQYDGHVWSR